MVLYQATATALMWKVLLFEGYLSVKSLDSIAPFRSKLVYSKSLQKVWRRAPRYPSIL